MVTNTELGHRLIEVCNKLNELGVFYGKNHQTKFSDKYPQSAYTFMLSLDNHKGGFESFIDCMGEYNGTIAVQSVENPALAIVELLEKSYEKLIKDLNK